MKQDKISVIICCYNTEKYIEKCLNSVINQTFKNLEIIIVEDCSTDTSLSIIKNFVKKDKRINLLINKINKGLSFSRNRGIKESTGKYLSFIDSDDYIPEDFFEKLYNSIKENDSDISVCDFNIVYENNNTNIISPACNGEVNAINIINNGLAAACCNKLIKKEKFVYLFEEGKVNEDIAAIIPILACSNNIAYTNETFYNYVQRENSIQNSKFSQRRFDIFDGVKLALNRIENDTLYEDIEEILVFNQLIALLLYVIPKDKNLFRRVFNINKFVKKIKGYNVLNNKYYLEFLNNSNGINKLYYKMFMFFAFYHMSFFTSLLILFYDFYKRISKKEVIKKNISYEDIAAAAKKHGELKQNPISITAIIPNYNYEEFLLERVYSILYQTKKIEKIIILDDCSIDNSREVMKKIKEEIGEYIDIELIYNKKNSGSPFKQWAKGIKASKSDYIWICEADDYVNNKFLENVCKPLKTDNEIVISYCDTAFIDKKGTIISRSTIPQIDLMNTGHWNNDYVNDGIKEVKDYAFLNCTIPNVSGTIIKNGDYSDIFKLIKEYRQAGDWLFYINVMKLGKVAFSKKRLNYYRVHGNNVSSVFKKQKHMDEIKSIHKFVREKFKLNKKAEKEIEKRYEFLKEVWKI